MTQSFFKFCLIPEVSNFDDFSFGRNDACGLEVKSDRSDLLNGLGHVSKRKLFGRNRNTLNQIHGPGKKVVKQINCLYSIKMKKSFFKSDMYRGSIFWSRLTSTLPLRSKW